MSTENTQQNETNINTNNESMSTENTQQNENTNLETNSGGFDGQDLMSGFASEDLGLETDMDAFGQDSNVGGKSEPTRTRLIQSIRNEINLLNGRKDLTILETNGKKENRFWKEPNNPEYKGKLVLFNLKVDKKIFPLQVGNFNQYNPTYMKIKNSKESVMKVLNEFLERVKTLPEKHILFDQFDNIQKDRKEKNEIRRKEKSFMSTLV